MLFHFSCSITNYFVKYLGIPPLLHLITFQTVRIWKFNDANIKFTLRKFYLQKCSNESIFRSKITIHISVGCFVEGALLTV